MNTISSWETATSYRTCGKCQATGRTTFVSIRKKSVREAETHSEHIYAAILGLEVIWSGRKRVNCFGTVGADQGTARVTPEGEPLVVIYQEDQSRSEGLQFVGTYKCCQRYARTRGRARQLRSSSRLSTHSTLVTRITTV